jgi:hypothetical protein
LICAAFLSAAMFTTMSQAARNKPYSAPPTPVALANPFLDVVATAAKPFNSMGYQCRPEGNEQFFRCDLNSHGRMYFVETSKIKGQGQFYLKVIFAHDSAEHVVPSIMSAALQRYGAEVAEQEIIDATQETITSWNHREPNEKRRTIGAYGRPAYSDLVQFDDQTLELACLRFSIVESAKFKSAPYSCEYVFVISAE